MNIRLILFASALCTLSFGCEMHPVTEEETGVKDRAKASAELQRALEPEQLVALSDGQVERLDAVGPVGLRRL